MNDKQKTTLIKSMAPTAKGLKGAKNDGGFFYLATDAKGDNAVMVVFDKKKDPEGKKTFRMGRGLLTDCKKAFDGKPFYSQGEIASGSPMVFSITKGNAKPAVIKRAFKGSDLLKEGVGSANAGALKGARIIMGGDGTSAPETPAATDEAALTAWKGENQELLSGLELSEAEIAELFAAEAAFTAYATALPVSSDEDAELQLRQAESEALLDELAEGAQKLEELKKTDLPAALAFESELNEKRVELAQKNPTGGDPFEDGALSATELATFTAAVRAGLELLLARVTAARQTIEEERARLSSLPPEEQDTAQAALDARRNALTTELDAIQKQLNASRTTEVGVV